MATDVPDCFDVAATTTHGIDEELVMGVRYREHPIECVQFHPESVLTAHGRDVVANFVLACPPPLGSDSARHTPRPPTTPH